MPGFAELTEQEISRRLEQDLQRSESIPLPETYLPPHLIHPNPRPAAVLIPLVRQESEWQVVFTRRTPTLVEHSGQVAFPGGRADPGDPSPIHTATREAYEEIGLLPQDVHVLGKLHNLLTISGYIVTPVVGVIPWPYPLHLALDEVSRVFTIPLRWLADPANYEVRTRSLPEPLPPVPVIYFSMFDEELLWGVSAQITVNLLRALRLLN